MAKPHSSDMPKDLARIARCELAPGIFAHRTTDPKRGICDDCGTDMRLEPEKACQRKKSDG